MAILFYVAKEARETVWEETSAKNAFKKIIYKQHMWRVYKHSRKDKDYEVYKEALNAATNEVRNSKRNFEHKL